MYRGPAVVFAVALLLPAIAAFPATTRELLRDPSFARGFTVWASPMGKIVVKGKLLVADGRGDPLWTLAQWNSKYEMATARREPLAGGGVRFGDGAKTVVVGPRRGQNAGLTLGVDSRKEYGSTARKPGSPWVHLLVAQQFVDPPAVGDLERLEFRVSARLLRAEAYPTADYSANVHAAQYTVFLTVQNLNRGSREYGRLLWFGIPLYDDRGRTPPRFTAPDDAGLFIYTPAGDTYTRESLHDRRWVTIRRDVAPLIREGLEAAWQRGFLTASRDLSDYRVAAINLGWEVPGIFDVAIQVRDLSLRAVTRSAQDKVTR